VHGGVLSVEPALGDPHGDEPVHPVALLETADFLADCHDRARSLGAEHVRELWFASIHLGEHALTLENVPPAHAGRLDLYQDLLRPNLGHGQRAQGERLETTKAVDSDSLHGVLNCLSHSYSLASSWLYRLTPGIRRGWKPERGTSVGCKPSPACLCSAKTSPGRASRL